MFYEQLSTITGNGLKTKTENTNTTILLFNKTTMTLATTAYAATAKTMPTKMKNF